jgi:hypothetical protein
MPDEPPLARQWILLRTLSARRHGATVKELGEELGPQEFSDKIREKLGGWEESTCKGRKTGHCNVDIGFSCVWHCGNRSRNRERAKKPSRHAHLAERPPLLL